MKKIRFGTNAYNVSFTVAQSKKISGRDDSGRAGTSEFAVDKRFDK